MPLYSSQMANRALAISKQTGAPVIPCKGKTPFLKGWNTFSLVSSRSKAHLLQFQKGNGIALLLGSPAGNLVALDVDTDDGLRELLKLNPQLNETLTITGRRGAKILFRTISSLPKTGKFYVQVKGRKTEWGDFLSEKRCVVVFGVHPDTGKPFVSNGKPILDFSVASIRFPKDVDASILSSEVDTDEGRVNSLIKRSNSNKSIFKEIPFPMRAKAESQRKCSDWQYSQFVQPHATGLNRGDRNSFLVKRVPLLFYALGEYCISSLMDQFYFAHKDIFKADIVQHRMEYQNILNGVRASYLSSLSKREMSVYENLDVAAQEAFRICRSLANHPTNEQNGSFFISCDDLRKRLWLRHNRIAQKLLEVLEVSGVIKLISKGRRVNVKNPTSKVPIAERRASEFVWLLS